jgi:hypothetical protein
MDHAEGPNDLGQSSQDDLAECYRQMAADIEHEAEAEEWAEALIGDVALDQGDGI